MKDTTQGVGQCHTAYQQVDDGVAQALGKLNGTMGQVDQSVQAASPHGGAA
jgi:hypothetical protein